ncbi:MAG: ABC transporter ATP-binding protein [Granulosicoccaceae bacterium]
MSDVLLQVRDLKTWFETRQGNLRAVDGVSFDIRRGETFALLGESGCGKSMTALSLMKLVPEPAGRIVSGSMRLGDTELMDYSEVKMRGVRGRRIAMIFQEPQTSLNPVLTIGDQIGETIRQHTALRGEAVRQRVLELLDAVGIPDPPRRIDNYPHQLSGGMKQRIMIAIALAAEPELLIADEPTTALDVTIQAQVLDLLKDLQRQTGMAILLITHDLGVVAGAADHVAVMYAGQIVEQASREAFFRTPQHPYSQKLFASLPGDMKRGQTLDVLRGSVPSLLQEFSGCRFAERCDFATDTCRSLVPTWEGRPGGSGIRCHLHAQIQSGQAISRATPQQAARVGAAARGEQLLAVEKLRVHFPIHRGLFKRVVGHVRAVDGVSLQLNAGQTLALVGESGCGKTTAGKGLLQLLPVTAGSVQYAGQELTTMRGEALRRLRSDLQIVFQDPFSSMNPRMLVGDIIAEGLQAQGMTSGRGDTLQRVHALLEQVGLSADSALRYPHEFSGGQRQRICIARALAVEPKLIVCDEPTSALDVSVQAQILNLLQDLQSRLGLGYLFITHNISVVEYLAHDIAVMYLGRIVEQGGVEAVLKSPKHPYTQALLSAVPVIDAATRREVIRLEGDLPSPSHPPQGCYFHPRCPHAMPVCRERYPEAMQVGAGHTVSCHLYSE